MTKSRFGYLKLAALGAHWLWPFAGTSRSTASAPAPSPDDLVAARISRPSKPS